jgi:hypothetical protein
MKSNSYMRFFDRPQRSTRWALAIFLTVGLLETAHLGVAFAESDECMIMLSMYREEGFQYTVLKSDGGASGNYVYLATANWSHQPSHILKIYPNARRAKSDFYGLKILKSVTLPAARTAETYGLNHSAMKVEYIKGTQLPDTLTGVQLTKYKNYLSTLRQRLEQRFPGSRLRIDQGILDGVIAIPAHLRATYDGFTFVSISIRSDNVVEDAATGDLVLIDPF